MTNDAAPTVLVVDDESAVRSALARCLAAIGYHTLEAETGRQALEQLHANRVSGMLSDIRMPGMSGVELLPKAIAADPDLAIIMLTAVGDPATAIECLKLGAADYLIKPVDLEELGLSLRSALRKRQLEIDRRDLEQWLAQEVARKTEELTAQQRRIERLSLSVIGALVSALEPAGPDGRTHSIRVARLAAQLAARMQQPPEAVAAIELAGRIHDIGRLELRDDLLARETVMELVGAKQDADVATRLLEPLSHHGAVLEIVRCQYERWDGRGPLGLKGEAIPLGARILAAANLYDELVAPAEPASGGLTPDAALENLHGLAGTLLDPAVLEALEGALAA